MFLYFVSFVVAAVVVPVTDDFVVAVVVVIIDVFVIVVVACGVLFLVHVVAVDPKPYP